MMQRGILLALLFLASQNVRAQPAPPQDWPCVQRYIPTLTASTYWTGPSPNVDWHTDPKVTTLVAETAPRAVSQDVATAKLQAYAETLPAAGRPEVLGTLFAGLVDETNRQRTEVMARLVALNRRQRDIGRMVEAIVIPPPDTDPAIRDELVQRREFLTREFHETEQTIRYACEVPVTFEARLGAFGRTLDAAQ